MDDGRLELAQVDDVAARIARQRRGRGLGGLQERVAVEAVRVGVSEVAAVGDPDAGAAIEPGRELLDLAVVEPDAGRGALLDEDLREPAAPGVGGGEDLLDELPVEHPPMVPATR